MAQDVIFGYVSKCTVNMVSSKLWCLNNRNESDFFLYDTFSSQFSSCNQTFEILTGNHIERICRIMFEGQQIKRSCPKLPFLCFLPFFQNCHFFVFGNCFCPFCCFLPFLQNCHFLFLPIFLCPKHVDVFF